MSENKERNNDGIVSIEHDEKQHFNEIQEILQKEYFKDAFQGVYSLLDEMDILKKIDKVVDALNGE